MKKALIVGINHYEEISPLFGCVNDATAVNNILEENGDQSKNFDCSLYTASGHADRISRRFLKDKLKSLFSTKGLETALFYFAGHGHVERTGGYLLTSDAEVGDEGVSLSEILIMANDSTATNKIIILDSCHAGVAGNMSGNAETATLSEGLTILTASDEEQYATEENGRGLFTGLLIDALGGSAANLTGDITPGSVYAHIDQSLGAWDQRPIFKNNVRSFVSLRKVIPPIELADLRKITRYFPEPGFEFQLDPSYEPEMKGRDAGMPLPNEENNKIFAVLQKYNRLNLLVPVGTQHMWNAAMESKPCKLTPLGEHYRRLVAKKRI